MTRRGLLAALGGLVVGGHYNGPLPVDGPASRAAAGAVARLPIPSVVRLHVNGVQIARSLAKYRRRNGLTG